MTNTRPECRLNGRYSTKETCAFLGIRRSTLYNWQAKGIITPHFRKVNNRPYFLGEDIINIYDSFYKL